MKWLNKLITLFITQLSSVLYIEINNLKIEITEEEIIEQLESRKA